MSSPHLSHNAFRATALAPKPAQTKSVAGLRLRLEAVRYTRVRIKDDVSRWSAGELLVGPDRFRCRPEPTAANHASSFEPRWLNIALYIQCLSSTVAFQG